MIQNDLKYLFDSSTKINSDRLDHFLQDKLTSFSRSKVKKVILHSGVLVNGFVERKPSRRLKFGDQIEVLKNGVVGIFRPKNYISPLEMDLKFLYEDSDIIVVDKPYGYVVHPSFGHFGDSILNGVYHYLSKSNVFFENISPVHRLDKDTSGVIVFSKNSRSHHFYSNAFKNRDVQKSYLCFVSSKFSFLEKNITSYIADAPKNRRYYSTSESKGASFAETFVRLLSYDQEKSMSLLAVYPKTGRTHQIRVHLSELGFPIVGDLLYGGDSYTRLMLHAHTLKLPKFELPGEYIELVSRDESFLV